MRSYVEHAALGVHRRSVNDAAGALFLHPVDGLVQQHQQVLEVLLGADDHGQPHVVGRGEVQVVVLARAGALGEESLLKFSSMQEVSRIKMLYSYKKLYKNIIT